MTRLLALMMAWEGRRKEGEEGKSERESARKRGRWR